MISRERTNNIAISIVLASLAAGLVYWLVAGGRYIALSLGQGYFPVDTLIVLVPVLLISFGVGVFICMPIILLLVRFDMNRLSLYMPLSIVVVSAAIFFLYNYHLSISDFFAAVTSAVVGSLVFHRDQRMRR